MCHKLTPQITGRALHALWLLLQHANGFDRDVLSSISQKVFPNSDKSDIQNLLQLGEYLGFLERDGSEWLLTKQGNSYKSSSHWRLWNPSRSSQRLFSKRKQSHFFINKEQYKKRPVVIDLFAGVGGLSLGFAAAGFNVVLAVDNDPQACEAHQKNFPETIMIQGDINEFANNPTEYLSTVAPQVKDSNVSGVIGGPPCQGFSYIGERYIEDERNLLTSKFIDIVLGLKPDFFVMENVPGLATSGILPEFSVYITRLGKVNGKPASVLVDKLPSIPKNIAKRDRQFRKRIISSVINGIKLDIEKQIEHSPLEIAEIKNIISLSYKKLQELISDTITENHKLEISQNILKENVHEICTLAIGIVFDVLFKRKVVKEADAMDYFHRLQNLFSNFTPFYKTISKLCSDYNNAPKAATYENKKIGPILLHLLEKAHEFYDIPVPQVLNAASFGTPQDRERMFIVGIKRTIGKEFTYPEPTHRLNGNGLKPSPPTVYEALHDLPDIDRIPHLLDEHEFSIKETIQAETDFVRAMRYELLPQADFSMPPVSWNPYSIDNSNRTTHEDHVKQRLETLEPGKQDVISRRTRLHPKRRSPTLRAGTKEGKGSHTAVRPIHYKYHRVISVREGARLMGYPDWMTFHKAKWHGFRLVGNGVPFPLSNAIAKQIKKLLYESEI